MNRFLLCLFIMLIFINTAHAKVKVVATLPVYGAIATAVGGDRVSVKSLAPAKRDPHFLDPKPSYVVLLNRADLLIYGGLDLESGWLPPILIQSRNPKIQLGNPGNVNASQGIRVLEIPTGAFNRSMGDVHPNGNPHYYLDPRNGSIIAQNIVKHLIEVDPEGETYFQEKLNSFSIQLKNKILQWGSQAQSLRGKKIITYHKTFTYLADWVGLQVVANVEPKPGIPPSSKHVNWLIKFIPENKVSGIFMAPFYPEKVPGYLSQKTGIPVKILPADTPNDSETAYFQLFDNLIRTLASTLK